MSSYSPRNPLVRPVSPRLFTRELARFWPRLSSPEAAFGDDYPPAVTTRRFQVDLLAMDDQQRPILLDVKWELPRRC
jgi:hypothetical protein